jgi:hypothetical protein
MRSEERVVMRFEAPSDDGTGRSVRAAKHVRYAVLDGFVIVLDLRAGNYVALDQAASESWIRLLESGITPDAPSKDAAFFADCERRGYLTQGAHTSIVARQRIRRSPLVPPAFYAFYTLMRTARNLKEHGFARTYDELASLIPPACSNDPKLVLRGKSAIAFAENFYTASKAPSDCLPRSLAIYRILLQAGLAPVHRIGVARMPFQAHAWVECGGKPVRDSEDFVRQFTVIAELP